MSFPDEYGMRDSFMDVTTNEWFITSATLAIPSTTSYADVSAEFFAAAQHTH